MSRDLKTAFRAVWLVVTVAAALAALAPFVVPHPVLARAAPVCESKQRYGKECWMCGTTTAFLAISEGNWGAAARANRAAIPIFGAFVTNAAIAAIYLVRRAR